MRDKRTALIRKQFVYSTGWEDKKVPGYSGVAYLRKKYAEEFDGWIAEHDRQIAAEAWSEGYQAGVHDERIAAGWDSPGRVNPYKEAE